MDSFLLIIFKLSDYLAGLEVLHGGEFRTELVIVTKKLVFTSSSR